MVDSEQGFDIPRSPLEATKDVEWGVGGQRQKQLPRRSRVPYEMSVEGTQILRNRSSWPSVRKADSRWLHMMGRRLQRDRTIRDLTQGQEALWHQLVSELEYRSARKRRWCEQCACDLCAMDPSWSDVEGQAEEGSERHYRWSSDQKWAADPRS